MSRNHCIINDVYVPQPDVPVFHGVQVYNGRKKNEGSLQHRLFRVPTDIPKQGCPHFFKPYLAAAYRTLLAASGLKTTRRGARDRVFGLKKAYLLVPRKGLSVMGLLVPRDAVNGTPRDKSLLGWLVMTSRATRKSLLVRL